MEGDQEQREVTEQTFVPPGRTGRKGRAALTVSKSFRLR